MKKYVLTMMGLYLSVCLWAQVTNTATWTEEVNQAATLIKSQPQAAENVFEELLKGKNKRNTALLVDIGEAYLQEGEYNMASVYAQRAKEVDNKYADAYLLSGNVAMARNDVNQASSDYSQAIYFDEDCSEAYLKYAELYQRVNPQLSLDMLQRLQNKMPHDIRIQKQLGDIYYTMGEYGKSITAYNDFMEKGTPSSLDFVRYATLLYLNKEYGQSLDMVKEGLQMEPDNLVLKRLAMYDNYELEAIDEGLEAAKVFFAIPDKQNRVYLDYVYYGKLLDAKEQYTDAIQQYKQALAMNAQHPEIYKEMAETYEKIPDYPNAIAAFKRYMEAIKEPSDAGDLFMYGQLNYFAASDPKTLAHQHIYLSEADSAFAEVAEYAPDNYLGHFWRARTNSLLDPETTQGLAKPYYEAALAILERKPDASESLLIECLSYLGYYYFVQEDYPNSKTYWTRILAIEPKNETALKALEGLQ